MPDSFNLGEWSRLVITNLEDNAPPEPVQCSYCGNNGHEWITCSTRLQVVAHNAARNEQRSQIMEDPYNIPCICGDTNCRCSCNQCTTYRIEWDIIPAADYMDAQDSDDDNDPDDSPSFSAGRDRLINSYSYRPRPNFMGEGPLYLGMEWEVEIGQGSSYDSDRYNARLEAAEAVSEVVGDMAYLKEDGSIGCGFELVTHPMSYSWFMQRFPFDRVASVLREHGAWDSRETGIHVHASMGGFGKPDGTNRQSHVYKWLQFIYRNADPVQRVARRLNSSWARFNDTDRTLAKYVAKGYPNRGLSYRDERQMLRDLRRRHRTEYINLDRYSAVNVDTGHGTYEVRVFRSTTEAREAQAAIGLVHASIEYTRQLTAHDVCRKDGWLWKAFNGWVVDHPEYMPLREELEVIQCVS